MACGKAKYDFAGKVAVVTGGASGIGAKSPMQRLGKPPEVAGMVAWLCSGSCSLDTGSVFDLSGGRPTC